MRLFGFGFGNLDYIWDNNTYMVMMTPEFSAYIQK